MKVDAAAAAVQVRHDKTIRFGERQSRSCTTCGLLSSIKAVENSSDEVIAQEMEEAEEENLNVSQIKQHLFAALQGINRGIFGVPSAKKSEIQKLVELLESQNPTPQPTLCLDKVAGAWKLIYSTISILGSKRTKLGLRDFINLGDFIQIINVAQGKAVNVIEFSAKGLTLLSGQLTIDASFRIASNSRVDINYQKSVITPDQLMNVFRKNYDVLLEIFNPDGWLEITYVDDSLRIGRDDKGNIFILENVPVDGALGLKFGGNNTLLHLHPRNGRERRISSHRLPATAALPSPIISRQPCHQH